MSAFAEPKPELPIAELEALAERLFGISGRARLLLSERDLNVRIDSAAGRFVLKVVNAAEDPGQIALQDAALLHLERVGATGVPRLVPLRDGRSRGEVAVRGKTCAIRMVAWLDGALLSEVARTPAQLADLGRFTGRISCALAGFGHPAAFRERFPWSLDQVADLRDHLGDIPDPARRALVARLFDRHAARVAPRLASLRASVLHQDANDNNVLVDPDRPDHVIGLIDFGDMCHGRTINELAITLAYAVLGTEDVYASMRSVIQGYVAEFPVTADEADVLYDLMRMRLVASVCISSRQARLHPGNAYLTISQEPAFALLERLDSIDPEFMVALCRQAAGHPATPGHDAVLAHLAKVAPADLFCPDLDTAARMALRTDGVLPGMPAYSDPAFDDWFTAQRPGDLPQGAPFYGFGPYGEKRGVYATAQFADRASPERRTRHLGIDVFAPAGTPLFAPLAGTVHSVSYNAEPLDYGHTLILKHLTPDGVAFFTLYGHLGGSLPGLLAEGDAVTAGQVIAHLGDWPENGGWAPHVHFQVMTDMLAQEGNFFGVGHDSLWGLWSQICIDPNLILRLALESFEIDPTPPEVLIERRKRRLGPSLSLSYSRKLKIVSGRGAWLTDHTGRRYLDAVNNITHVGHCHPHVVEALARQAARLNTNTRYLNALILDYADRLTAKLPSPLSVAFFVNSGTEANELALRIARTALGRKDTVVLDWAYHGNSGGMVEVSPYKFRRRGGFPQPSHVRVATFPDPFRGPHRGPQSGAAYAADVERCLEDLAQETGDGRASFIAESISGVGGQVVYPPGYLQAAYAAVRARGGICIADEVQCGFGRVGSHFWGFETQGVVPDIVVMGKPIGNGHPLAAVVTTPDLAARFANGMEYFNSFGGNPVSMAVGHAVLDVIESEGLQASAKTTGDGLLHRFAEMQARFPIIGDVRGMGLFLGIELVRDGLAPASAEAARIVNHMARAGVLASTDGPDDNVLKFKPPLVFAQPEAEVLARTLEAALVAEGLVA
jgi:4-aminobutyrate aminotransferase-like enzyme/Ser/Thr protein kinase RdoA (MazF antagonist)